MTPDEQNLYIDSCILKALDDNPGVSGDELIRHSNGIALVDCEEIAENESLVDQELSENIPVTIWVGTDEREIYLEQAKQLASKWGCPWFKSKNRHHFDIIDGLETKSTQLMNVLLSKL